MRTSQSVMSLNGRTGRHRLFDVLRLLLFHGEADGRTVGHSRRTSALLTIAWQGQSGAPDVAKNDSLESDLQVELFIACYYHELPPCAFYNTANSIWLDSGDSREMFSHGLYVAVIVFPQLPIPFAN